MSLADSSSKFENTEIFTRDLSIYKPDGGALVENLTMSVSPGEVLGIIGDEGVGKSTLMKALTGNVPAGFSLSGELSNIKCGYLSQTLEEKWKSSEVFEHFFQSIPTEEVDVGIWNEYKRVAEAVARVGLEPGEFLRGDRVLGQLSGGEAARIRMAKLFFEGSKVLLLDEPTNNLDLRTITWLESFIEAYEHPIVVVSHDERFLENTTDKILYLQKSIGDKPPLYRINGNGYRAFQESFKNEVEVSQKKGEEFRARQKQFRMRLNEERQKSASLERKQKPEDAATKGRKRRGLANATQQRARVQSNMEREQAPEIILSIEKFDLPLPESCVTHAGKSVCNLQIDELEVAGKVLAKDISFQVSGGEKVVIQGDNGVGKSTLLGHILDDLRQKEDSGIRVGYLPQDYFSASFSDTATALSVVTAVGSSEERARGLLARLGLGAQFIERKPSELSSGQLCKVFIACLIAQEANVLVLDEPTNNLYPLTAQALSEFLSAFPGSIIAVSHDRAFTERVADRVVYFSREGGLST